MKNLHKINENIYITNGEEIKEGDWILNFEDDEEGVVTRLNDLKYLHKQDEKIILTTDQKLITYGIEQFKNK